MNVKCIGQLLTCWLENAPRKDVEQLCQALQACLTGGQPTGLTQVLHDDTNTVALAGQGTNTDPLTANVKVSADTGNSLVMKPDGLFVKPGEGGESAVTTQNTNSINFQGEGVEDAPLTAEVRVSSTEGNTLAARTDGLYAASHAVTSGFSPATLPITTGSRSQAWGALASAGAARSVAIGPEAKTTATSAIAIGEAASAQGTVSIAIGKAALTSPGGSSIAVGSASNASGNFSAALGTDARASHPGSVAIGALSDTSRANEIAFASLGTATSTSTNPRILAGVADPEVSQDAVNLITLDRRFPPVQRAAIDALDPATATLADVIGALQATTS